MKERQSSMELLRLVLMLLIVALHLNYLGIGVPTSAESQTAPISTFGRIWAEQICACAVNAFVLLSGWFGLRWHWGRLWRNILLRCVVYGLLIVIAVHAFTKTPIDWHYILKALLPAGEYWFIVCYVGLWLLAPVLNTYVEQASGRSLWLTVVALIVFEWLYGWLYDAALLNGGYSIFSFVVLYLLARALRLYPAPFLHKGAESGRKGGNDQWQSGRDGRQRAHGQRRGAATYFAVFAICSLLGTVIAWGALRFGGSGTTFVLFAMKSYLSPLVVGESAAIVLAFSRMRFHSRLINYLGGSALAIYLIHAHPLVARPLLEWTRGFYLCHTVAESWAGLCLMCMGICAICLLIDIILFRITRISSTSVGKK